MQKLIIAHHSDVLVDSLEDVLHNEWEIHTCTTSYPVADMLQYIKPDALVIDLNIRPKDGLTLLAESSCTLPRYILAITNYASPPILHKAETLGVSSVITIPCSTNYIKKLLHEIIDDAEGESHGHSL